MKTTRQSTMAMLLAVLVGIAAYSAVPAAEQLRTVPRVDLDRYVGRWYEVAKYPNRFQTQCAANATATYRRRDDGAIQVRNRCLRADGTEEAVDGIARIVDAQSNAKLEVTFLPRWLRWVPAFWGDYWVIDLAPDYSFAVVGEPKREYLWVLARTPTLDDDVLEGIRQRLRQQGYDPSRLERSPQR